MTSSLIALVGLAIAFGIVAGMAIAFGYLVLSSYRDRKREIEATEDMAKKLNEIVRGGAGEFTIKKTRRKRVDEPLQPPEDH